VQPVGAGRRFVDETRELRPDPLRRLKALWHERYSSKSTEPGEGPLLPQAAQRTIDAKAIFLPVESIWL
jgi:hypothetical protein